MKITTFRSNIEARSFTEGGEMIVEGYAIITNSPAPFKIWGEDYLEVITPSALESADISNVVLNREHKDEYTVARTTNGTLQLTKDEKGLHVRAKLSQNQTSKDLYEDIKSGLLNKMSFRAEFEAEEFVEATDKVPEFRITKLGRVFDVSVVAFPFYEDTEINARNNFFEEELMKKPKLDIVVEKSNDIDIDALAKQVLERAKEIQAEEKPIVEEVADIEVKDEAVTETIENDEETKNKDVEGGTEMLVLSEQKAKSQMNETEKRSFKKEYDTVAFMARLGNVDARSRFAEIKERAEASGLTNLIENHTGATAEYTIPEVVQSEVIQTIKNYSDVLSKIKITNVRGDLKFITNENGITAKFYADGEKAGSSKSKFDTFEIKGNRVTALAYISNELLSATMEEMLQLLISQLAEAIADVISEKVFTGNGTSEPLGVLNYATDVTAELGTGTLVDKLRKVKRLFPQGMRKNVEIHMSEDDYFDKYLALTDTAGQPIQGITDDMFKGTKVHTDINIPKGVIVVCDFNKYQANFTKQTQVSFSDDANFESSVRTYKAEAVVGGSPTTKQAFKKFNLV